MQLDQVQGPPGCLHVRGPLITKRGAPTRQKGVPSDIIYDFSPSAIRNAKEFGSDGMQELPPRASWSLKPALSVTTNCRFRICHLLLILGKHPVSRLLEICRAKRWGLPEFECEERGQKLNKRFIWTVRIVLHLWLELVFLFRIYEYL
jgi:hypothetical protein